MLAKLDEPSVSVLKASSNELLEPRVAVIDICDRERTHTLYKLEIHNSQACRNKSSKLRRRLKKRSARKEQRFQKFLSQLGTLTLHDTIPRSADAGEKHVMVIGNISVGKTSLLSALFGLRLPVSLGHTTTTGASPVVKDATHKLVVWDVAGNNQDFDYLDPAQLNLFHSADVVFVLYDSSLRACNKIVRTVAQIKGNRWALIRTKCDTWEADHTDTIDQEIAKDRADLAQWGITMNVEIYKTSKRGGFDNDAVLAKMRRGA